MEKKEQQSPIIRRGIFGLPPMHDVDEQLAKTTWLDSRVAQPLREGRGIPSDVFIAHHEAAERPVLPREETLR